MELCIEEHVKVWRRTRVTVDAFDEEDAVRKYLDGDFDVKDSYYLDETEEALEPGNGATTEIFSDTDALLWSDNDGRGIQEPDKQ